MNSRVQLGLIILGMICLNANVFAQANEWKTEKTKDGEVIVRSRISDRIDESGEAVQLIEYVATTTVSVDIQQCIAVVI